MEIYRHKNALFRQYSVNCSEFCLGSCEKFAPFAQCIMQNAQCTMICRRVIA